MLKKLFLFFLPLVFGLIVCVIIVINYHAISEDQNKKSVRMSDVTSKKQNRISVVRIDIIKDRLAYNGERGVYLITDLKTGKEYIGISGVGIAETSEYRSGKNLHFEER